MELSLVSANRLQLAQWTTSKLGHRQQGTLPSKTIEKIQTACPSAVSFENRASIRMSLGDMSKLCAVVNVPPINQQVIVYAAMQEKALVEEARLPPITDKDIQAHVDVVLKPYQLDVVNFVWRRKRALLALQMGLGKTLCSIVTMMMVLAKKPSAKMLVVCPGGLRLNWVSEFIKFCNGKMECVNIDKGSCIDKVATKTVTVIGYALLARHVDAVKTQQFDVIVADEAHAIKHQTSQRAQAFTTIAAKAEYVLLLTGTPAQRHCNFFNLLRQLDGDFYKTFHHYQPKLVGREESSRLYFGERYCAPKVVYRRKNQQGVDFNNNSRAEELKYLSSFRSIRYTKQELNLPPIITDSVIVGELSKPQKREFEYKMQAIETARETKGTKVADHMLMSLVRDTSKYKIPYVKAYIENIVNEEDYEPFIVFTATIDMQNALAEILDKKKINYIQINGSVSMKNRMPLLEKLRKGEATVALLSLQTCASGLNIAYISITIFAELSFDSIAMEQATSRTHRIGNTSETVVLKYLKLEGSTDSNIWNSLRGKNNCSKRLLDDSDVQQPASKKQKQQHTKVVSDDENDFELLPSLH